MLHLALRLVLHPALGLVLRPALVQDIDSGVLRSEICFRSSIQHLQRATKDEANKVPKYLLTLSMVLSPT